MRAAVAAGACLVAVAVSAAGPPPFAMAGADEEDVIGRPVSQVFSSGRPVLLLYANEQTQADTDEPGTAFAVRVRDVPMAMVVRVDLRDVLGMFHFVARRVMRGRHAQSMEEYAKRAKAAGRTPMKDPEQRLYIVADEAGVTHAAVGLPKGFTRALAIVLDADGRERARGAFPTDAAKLEAALRAAAPAPPK